MKLLKKIAPFAVTALFMAAPIVGALNIADWKDQFTASNTAVVVGNGVTNEGDIAAAMVVAKDVGIDTTVTTLGSESYKFEKTSDKFNLGDGFYYIKQSIDDDELSGLLVEGTYSDYNSAEYEYTQKLTFFTGAGLNLTHFADSNFDNKEPTLGFHLPDDTNVMNYTLDFKSNPDWDDGDLEKSVIDIMGKKYYISDVNEGGVAMTLLDASNTQTVPELGSVTFNGKVIKVSWIGVSGSTNKVKLEVDGVGTSSLAEGGTYNIGGGKYVAVKDIMYVSKDTGTSQVELAFGNGKIEITNGQNVELNDDTVNDLYGFITNTSTAWTDLTLQWKVSDETFLTPGTSISFPEVGAIQLSLQSIDFPAEENINFEGGDDKFVLTVPITSGTADIPLLYANSSGYGIDGIGEDSDNKLVTANISYLFLNESAGEKYFVATWVSGKDFESYYLSASVYTEDSTNKTKITNEVTNQIVCDDLETLDDCDIGDVSLTITYVNKSANNYLVNVSAGSGVNFYTLYSDEGMKIYLPYNNLAAGVGAINLTVDPTKWNLTMVEEDREGTLANGDGLNLSAGFTAVDNHATINEVYSNDWLGTGYLESKSDADTYIGYVESDLGTKITYDKSGDEYTVDVTYHGDEVTAAVYISSGGESESTSWTPVYDGETDKYVSKNIVVIGGTAVNKVARKMFGLVDTTPVYGTEEGWLTKATDGTHAVDAAGKGILWLQSSPYTEGTGKYALLVAGYTGDDTLKLANYLDVKTPLPAKEKAIINTVALSEAS
jgi:hypothetical protein